MIAVVLASRSASRASLLASAGVDFVQADSEVDETRIKDRMLAAGATPLQVAAELGDAKALAVSRRMPGLVIGADQTLDLGGRLFDKAETVAIARERLISLRGHAHHLHAGVTLARDGRVLWRRIESARLTMRAFSDAFLDQYLASQGAAILSSVGCYHLEGAGAQLFERIEGDYFSILGLPLLPLLDVLRAHGAMAE